MRIFETILTILILLLLSSCSEGKNTNSKDKKINDDTHVKQSLNRLKGILSHDTLSKTEIISADESNLEDLIFSNIYVNINAYTNEEYSREFQAKFTIPQRVVYSTLLIERNFNAGQLFLFYDRFDFASKDAVTGYHKLGFPFLAKTVGDGHKLYNEMREKNSLSFSNLDTLFKNNFDKNKTSQARITYIRQNLDSFTQK